MKESDRTYKRVALITSGFLPVPPSKGGAVENIIYSIIKHNEEYPACRLTVFSIDDESEEKYKYTEIRRFKPSSIVKLLDKVTFTCIAKILHNNPQIIHRYFFQRLEFMRNIGKCLYKETFDRVILENSVLMFKALTYKNNLKRYKGKIYYHAHNRLNKTLGYEKYLYQVSKIIAVSDYIKAYYENLLGADRPEIETIRNVADKGLFSKVLNKDEIKICKEEYGISNNLPVLLFVGRLAPEKGIMHLLEALRQLDRDDYNLLIVGTPFYALDFRTDYENELQDLSDKIKGNIHFTGYVPYEQMYKLYQSADLCVLPSVWGEPCSLTVIECVLSGTPLITTNTGGNPEIVVESTVSLDTDNLINQLKRHIEKYLNNPEEIRRFKDAAKRDTIELEMIEEYYNHLMMTLDINR